MTDLTDRPDIQVRTGAAFFDLDKTVISRPAMIAFAMPLKRAGLITWGMVGRAAVTGVAFRLRGADADRLEQYQDRGLEIVKGWDAAEVRRVVEGSVEKALGSKVYAGAITLVRAHQSAGRPAYLISAEPEEIVEPVAAMLGFDGSVASQAETDAEGRYTGRALRYARGPAKAEAMRSLADEHQLDLGASFAYSDSATDIPMLEAVGTPVAVNPDRELAAHARRRGWELRRFP